VKQEQEIYNLIRNDIFLKDVLPEMHRATINISIECENADQKDIYGKLKDLSTDNGWCLYRDKFVNGKILEDKTDFIEGEWNNGLYSIRLQLINDGYQLIKMQIDKKGNEHLYHIQEIVARNKTRIFYRVWWQESSGRIEPFLQEFIGNTTQANQSTTRSSHDS